MQNTKFNISGMSCAACSANIEKTVKKLPGVTQADVNLLAGSMVAGYDPALLSPAEIISAIEKIGYGAAESTPKNTAGSTAEASNPLQNELQHMKRRLIWSAIFMLPLMYVSMGHMLGLVLPSFLEGDANAASFALTQLLLTLPIVLANHKYFTSGFKSLFHRTPNMDSLIALGAGASLVYGIFALYRISYGLGHGNIALVHQYLHDLYFESAAMILTLITLGKTLEAYSKGRTGAAIGALLKLAPKTALLLKDGQETEVDIAHVQKGDVLAVKPGARVPVDGVVLSGKGVVDESALTGESMPIEKQEGSSVTGATINTSGYFTMRAERIADQSAFAQILALVQEAGASKAPIAKLADKVSGVFVPIVMGIALVCFAAWLLLGYGAEFALARSVTVLVISCPCALGLATPVAIMVGTGRGAKNGILYRNAEALETLSRVDTIVFDKTGTLTEGSPRLTDCIAFERSENELLAAAAALEAKSEHPLALAILNEAARLKLHTPVAENFASLSGLGIEAHIGSSAWLAGNERLMREHGVELADAIDTAHQLSANGKTPLYFAENKRLAGLIAVADLPKPDAAQAVSLLAKKGITTIMLTGDTNATARAIQGMVGVSKAIAEVLPQEKEQQIRMLMQQGHKVAMVGDGVNDAPALARADVGIAVGAGTDVAIEQADIVLMRSELSDIVTAHELSRSVLRNIKQNLFWAFFYNVIGIPIAAGLFYPALVLNPMFGAAAMSLSSLFVVGNALRLNLFSSAKAPAQMQSHIQIPTPKEEVKMTKIIKIEGMTCGHCKKRVEDVLSDLPNVVSAQVLLEDGTATVEYSSNPDTAAAAAAVEGAGYTVIDIT